MKQQYAWLLNHISADPIKQQRTKLSPKSRHKEDSWAIESTGLHPHLLHHIPHSPNTDMFSVGSIADVAASWQNSNTYIQCGRVIMNCSWRPQQLQESMWILRDSTAPKYEQSNWQEHSANGSDTKAYHVTHTALSKRRVWASFKMSLLDFVVQWNKVSLAAWSRKSK